MLLRDYTIFPSTAIVEEVQKKASEILLNFSRTLKSGITPPSIIRTYSSLISDLNNQWKLCVKHQIRSGRQLHSIYVDGCNHYTMTMFISETFNFKVNHGTLFRRINYSFDKFYTMAKMEAAFLLMKYDEVYNFEIQIAIVTMLFKYFNLYTQNGYDDGYNWAICADDITRCLNEICQIEMKSLKSYADKIGDFVPTVKQQPLVKKPKPTCKEDIERCISEGMRQTDIAESIMDNWDVSRPTAYRLMKQFGYTRNYKKKSDTDKQQMTSTTAAEEIPLQVMLQSKDYEIKKLKEEIERLKKELEKQK